MAVEAGLDIDEALVTLWDAGLDSVRRPSDAIRPAVLSQARSALGLASKRELNSVNYWCNRLDIDDRKLRELLAGEGLELSIGARTLPKGGVAAMRKFERAGAFVVEIAKAESVRASRKRHGIDSAPPPPVEWRCVGRPRDLHYLEDAEVRDIHQQLFDDFLQTDNPIDTPGTRSDDLLSSACERPRTGLDGTLKYPSVELAAAALAHSLVNNHAFWNGNKRTALVAYLVFLDENGFVVTCSDEDLFRFILKVSQHRLVPRDWPELPDREVLAMAEWTKANTRQLSHGERIIKWHQLRKMLGEYGVRCEQAKNVGNRMNLYRDVEERRSLGFGKRKRTLQCQVVYGDEGREVNRGDLRRLRTALQLDDEHGVDSSAFYDGDPRPAGEFILEYRRILRRLAKL
ncbi:type II toxin-antitoxin system death-on-curing family toxin [uncultured Nocardioides sp.]|uniref:type II toxin-antitoxin system death-on-curing family toxin n=1 Tax=uncultured Nocardioides sp. TaxID=198441 RepID=UPI002626A7A8|nr:type II toxin-antitoxin system death-on-curing family toxin [uncultured Nocardioides sp.]